MKKLQDLIISIAISLGIGALAGFITRNNVGLYNQLIVPEVAPPNYVFPIVWAILYVLMGIAAYLIFISDSPYKRLALSLYAVQLFLNFIWSPIFFNLQMFLLALVILILLLIVLFYLIFVAYKVNPKAAYLLIPYFLWVIFATYLNFYILLLNG